MQDWLGNELNVGDSVIYAAGSGRSITMVIGTIVEFKSNGNIRVQPLNSSRWKQHHGTDYYVDTRTGKRIDPWKTYDTTGEHVERKAHYRHKVTGKVVTSADWHNMPLMGRDMLDWECQRPVWKAHVEARHEGPKPVTITVTENLTLWTGEVPEPKEAEGE